MRLSDRLENIQDALDKVRAALAGEHPEGKYAREYRRVCYLGSAVGTAKGEAQRLEWELGDWQRVLTEGLGPCAQAIAEELAHQRIVVWVTQAIPTQSGPLVAPTEEGEERDVGVSAG